MLISGSTDFRKILRCFLEPLDRFPDLTSDFRQLLGAEQQERDHQNNENFADAQSEHGSSYAKHDAAGETQKRKRLIPLGVFTPDAPRFTSP